MIKVPNSKQVHKNAPAETLSQSELDVLCLCLQGFSSPMIAAELNISESEVDSYLSNLAHKVNLQDRAELLSYIRDHELECQSH